MLKRLGYAAAFVLATVGMVTCSGDDLTELDEKVGAAVCTDSALDELLRGLPTGFPGSAAPAELAPPTDSSAELVVSLLDAQPAGRLVTDELHELLAELDEAGGGRLEIPARPDGLSWFASNVSVPSNVAVVGLDGARIALATADEASSIFVLDGVSGASVSGLRLNVGFCPGNGVDGSDFNTFGLRADRSADIAFHGNVIENADHGGIALFASDRSRVLGNTIVNSSRRELGAHIWLFGSSNNEVRHNLVLSNQGGIGVIADDASSSLSPNSGIASGNTIADNTIMIRNRGNQADPSATGIIIESGVGNEIRDNLIVAHWIGIQVQTAVDGSPLGDWGPTQRTLIDGNDIYGEGVGVIGVQAEKGADSTRVIGGHIEGFSVAGIRFRDDVAQVGDPAVNGVEPIGIDAVLGTTLAGNGEALAGLATDNPNVNVEILGP